jgi:hypothetical protein
MSKIHPKPNERSAPRAIDGSFTPKKMIKGRIRLGVAP